MNLEYLDIIFDLLTQLAVFMMIAYLFSKSPAFRPLTGETLPLRNKLILYFVFSGFSIMGTYFGLPVQDAIANTRAIGAVLAGLIGGPVLGVSVGFTAGLHRYSMGGFTAFSCGVSTTLEGLIGGLVFLYLQRHGKSEDNFNPRIAFLATFVAEMVQMAVILLLAKPFVQAWALVQVIALPMMLANSVGAALFMSIIRDQKSMYDRVGALFSAKALNVADRTLGILGRGFNETTARELAEIIHDEIEVGAVSITDREKILAFVGLGDDHHLPGMAIASPQTRQAIAENQVIYLDGVREEFTCPFSDACPLGSVLIVPLRVDKDVIGTIRLYESKDRLFLNLNKTMGEGIAKLLSEQLLRYRYEHQKNLLLQSELKLVQAQVNPHFLFNALNTIIAIARNDSDQARDLLRHLSNFFRKNLKRSDKLATLEEELDHARSYLRIEKARFADQLQVEEEVDPQLLKLKVPTFTLQPLVENAIKHGTSTLLGPGLIKIRVFPEGDIVRIVVEDNAGAYSEEAEGDGLGMNIVEKRIRNLFGHPYGVEVFCEPEQVTRVTVTVPLAQGEAA